MLGGIDTENKFGALEDNNKEHTEDGNKGDKEIQKTNNFGNTKEWVLETFKGQAKNEGNTNENIKELKYDRFLNQCRRSFMIN